MNCGGWEFLYRRTAWVGNVDSPSTGFGVTSTVDVSANATSLGAFTNSCTTCTTTQAWQMFATTFTAASASTTLRFLNGDPSNDNSNGLDNVSLVDNGPVAAVPEPSSIVPLGSGLLGLAGWLLARGRRTA
ncbi:MAG TPA: PEP-CTERM sorting domain-containing protein [Bryobacteraceae bacterium]